MYGIAYLFHDDFRIIEYLYEFYIHVDFFGDPLNEGFVFSRIIGALKLQEKSDQCFIPLWIFKDATNTYNFLWLGGVKI